MKRLLLPALLLVIVQAASAQQSSLAYRKLADSLYRNHHYQDAAEYYERAIKKAKDPGNIMLKIAKSYAKINAINVAEQWFTKAKQNNALMTEDDVYQYAQVLTMEKKRAQAEAVLRDHLTKDPNAWKARLMLEDLNNYHQFYKDSAHVQVAKLPFSTAVSEFAPAYYKDGIVFTSATEEDFSKKKYHWDKSNFLNLYFTKKSSAGFLKPVLFEKELNTKYHDGPATFYSNYSRMVVNRNQPAKASGKSDTFIWHLSLFDATYAEDQSTWMVNALPFDEPPYSFVHPWIAEDGNVIFFVSDRPGGYGGTDIYRAEKINGTWSKPFNLGPVINTTGNEVFPYVVNNVLFFASNGHGGMGGLDIFKSSHAANGFTPPVNLGYPINSPADDFSLITKTDEYAGYFASARGGNDDMYEFTKVEERIHLLARIVDGKTKKPIESANLQVITLSDDLKMIADESGNVYFDLPAASAFVAIASKDGKVGMLSASAETSEDRDHVVHEIPLYGDTTRVAMVGTIKNELGGLKQPSDIKITDKQTGRTIASNNDNGLITFFGEKAHTYSVELTDASGTRTTQDVSIAQDGEGVKTWEMTVRDTNTKVHRIARVFNEPDSTPLANADVRIITFDEPDHELTANEQGLVEFQLSDGTAYIVIASGNNMTGMNSGIVGLDDPSSVLPVPAHGDPPPQEVPVVAMITDKKGKILEGATVKVTNRNTGVEVPVTMGAGVISFPTERGQEYNMSIDHHGHKTTLEEVKIPTEGPVVEKIAVVMEDEEVKTMTIALKAVKNDQTPLANAEVRVIVFDGEDQVFTTRADGTIDINLPEGTAYMIVVSNDGYSGMLTGSAEKGEEKAATTHTIVARADVPGEVPVVALVTNTAGDALEQAAVAVREKETGEKVQTSFKDGMLSFPARKGMTYDVTIEHKNHIPITQVMKIPEQPADVQKISIAMKEKENPAPSSVLMSVKVVHGVNQTSLAGAEVTIISFTEPDQVLKTNPDGTVDFTLPEGTPYMIVVRKDGFSAMETGTADKSESKMNTTRVITAVKEPTTEVAVAGRVVSETGNVLENVKAVVTEISSGKLIASDITAGLITFTAEKGRAYDITVEHEDHTTTRERIAIPVESSSAPQKIAITMDQTDINIPILLMAAKVVKAEDQRPLGGAEARIISFTGPDQVFTANSDGAFDFTLPEGTAYMIVVTKDGYSGMLTGTADEGEGKLSTTHVIAAAAASPEEIAVVGNIVDNTGEKLIGARVTVKEKMSGKTIVSESGDGLLTFAGEKGKDYVVTVEHDKHQPVTQNISIPANAQALRKMSIAVEQAQSSRPANVMSVKIVKDTDKSPLSRAKVTVITFSGKDEELTANEDGIVDFSLPDGTPYMIVVSGDGFSGMYTGISSEEEGKNVNVQEMVVTHSDDDSKLPAVVKLVDPAGKPLTDVSVRITDVNTGVDIPSTVQQGAVVFKSEQGKKYKIAATVPGFEPVESVVTTGVSGQSVSIHRVALKKTRPKTSATVATAVANNKPGAGASSGSEPNVVVMTTADGTSKGYVKSKGTWMEVVEENGTLKVRSTSAVTDIGQGTVSDFISNPGRYLQVMGEPVGTLATLQHIYFDYDNAQLDDGDKAALDNVYQVLRSFDDLKLVIRAHADDRGRENYNLNLSRRRAKSVAAYLRKRGMDRDRVVLEAFGEAFPAIPCETKDCSEDEHQKNRRAEFALATSSYVAQHAPAVTGSADTRPKSSETVVPVVSAPRMSFEQVLEQYGDAKVDGVTFRIVVGAYRYNTTLTFSELSPIGKVESTVMNGITYYYVGNIHTLNDAERIRASVGEAGIKDAWMMIMLNGEKISLQRFITLVKQ